MSRHNRPNAPPPKAPEPKVADAPAPVAPPAENDLQAQIAAQMAAAEASRGAVGAVEGADSSIQVTEPSNDPAGASPDGEDAEEGDETSPRISKPLDPALFAGLDPADFTETPTMESFSAALGLVTPVWFPDLEKFALIEALPSEGGAFFATRLANGEPLLAHLDAMRLRKVAQAQGNLVTLHVSPNIDPTLAEAFGATPKASEPKAARFKVWSHGSLQCDGTTYLPGEALPFSAARIAALGIQHLAVPIED